MADVLCYTSRCLVFYNSFTVFYTQHLSSLQCSLYFGGINSDLSDAIGWNLNMQRFSYMPLRECPLLAVSGGQYVVTVCPSVSF